MKNLLPNRDKNLTALDSLARLLAVENISIQHQPVETAMFNTVSRTLVLPIWENMTQEVYDMLVGHEVGHALFTPADEISVLDAVKTINEETGANQNLAKTTLNIVEDARIEKLMKERYPGLRRDFVKGYKWLYKQDFFGIRNVNIDEMSILDRLNLHYKLGTINIVIPFNEIEKVFISKIDKMTDWDDVVEMSIEILKFYKDNRSDEDDEQSQNDSGAGASSNDEGENDGQGQSSKISNDGFEDDTKDDNGSDGSSTSDTDDDEESLGALPSDAGDDADEESSGSESGSGIEDDTDDGESAKSDKGMMESDGDSGDELGMTPDQYTNDGWGNDSDCQTNENLNDKLKDKTNTSNPTKNYRDNPKMLLDNIIVNHTEIAERFDNIATVNSIPIIDWDGADQLRKIWERHNMPVINNMAKQFEMKKSADVHRRTLTTKTGRLDMNRLHAYKTSEDIFLSAQSVADGQNHGLQMFIDWSGSMSSSLASTCSQLLNLVYFAKKANIPFDVYAFTSQISTTDNGRSLTDEEKEAREAYRQLPMNEHSDNLKLDKFRLLHFLSSDMNPRQFRRAVQQMMIIISQYMRNGRPGKMKTIFGQEIEDIQQMIKVDDTRSYHRRYIPTSLHLGCTPLNECILAAKDIVNNFKTNHNVQICNTVFLTDGQSSSNIDTVVERPDGTTYSTYSDIYIKSGRKEFNISTRNGYDSTNQLLRWLEAETQSNVLGFYICSVSQFRTNLGWKLFGEYDYDKQAEMYSNYKSSGFAVLPDHPGYNEFYALDLDKKQSKAKTFDDLDDSASYVKLRNAFIKKANNKKAIRTIMVRFAEIFATNNK